MLSAGYSFQILMKLEIPHAIFEKYSKPNSMTIRPLGAEFFHADRQANRYTKLILGSRNFANSPKMRAYESILCNVIARIM